MDGLGGTSRLAGLELGASLGDTEFHKGLPKAFGITMVAVQEFGLKKIVPGRFRVVGSHVAFASFDKAANNVAEEGKRAFVPLGRWLTQNGMGFFEAPILERFLSLPDCQPPETKHGIFASVP
jgi:hypothetical protein